MQPSSVNKWAIQTIRTPGQSIPVESASHIETNRSGNREFGSVFKRARYGGPSSFDEKLPGWKDPRFPGNTDANESAKSIMSKWPPEMVKRFRIFVDSFKEGSDGMTPWRQEWLDKTAPGYDKDREKILKCKLELIRRILKIKAVGPETLEDWILLFLYHDRYILIPPDIDTLINPEYGKQSLYAYFEDHTEKTPRVLKYFYTPAEDNVDYPANMYMPGIADDHIPIRPLVTEYGPTNRRKYPVYYPFANLGAQGARNRNTFEEQLMTTFPASVSNALTNANKALPDQRKRDELRRVMRLPRAPYVIFSKYNDNQQGNTSYGPA